jgi:hypothetical protein
MAALVSMLLHGLLFVVMMRDPPITTAMQQAEAGSSAMSVTLIDPTLPPAPAEPVPPAPTRARPKKPKAPRPPPTPVEQATVPMPAEVADTPDTTDASPDTAHEPTEAPRETAKVARPPHVWGQPPGMDANAIASAALAAKLGGHRGRGNTSAPPPVGPDMAVDGFQVFYELANETRLRAWRAQGMTELFLPMPGSLRLMVCPLEVALRRGSSACRMVEPDSPQLKVIGDARDVISIRRVYQLGELVWSGPGPYR